MKNDALNRFKEEMNRRGLIRKIQVCANLIPPPPDADPESLIQLHRNAAKMAIANYAANHDDFYEVMFDAALDHLLDGVLTDDLFAPDKEFAPTKEEVDTMNRAKETAELVNGLFHGLADILKTI
jgi:hypothetical protein|nr:MAG TPA: hypothetical protein [Caudoviricetes sp.]